MNPWGNSAIALNHYLIVVMMGQPGAEPGFLGGSCWRNVKEVMARTAVHGLLLNQKLPTSYADFQLQRQGGLGP